jgi:hypothetical protein
MALLTTSTPALVEFILMPCSAAHDMVDVPVSAKVAMSLDPTVPVLVSGVKLIMPELDVPLSVIDPMVCVTPAPKYTGAGPVIVIDVIVLLKNILPTTMP